MRLILWSHLQLCASLNRCKQNKSFKEICKMTSPSWSSWCRLCAIDSNAFMQDLKNLDIEFVNALQKHFDIKICWNESSLSTKLCSYCYKLLNDLIKFSARVSKAKAIFEVVRFFDTDKLVDVKALRQHWGLEVFSPTLKSNGDPLSGTPEFIDIHSTCIAANNEKIESAINKKSRSKKKESYQKNVFCDDEVFLEMRTGSALLETSSLCPIKEIDCLVEEPQSFLLASRSEKRPTQVYKHEASAKIDDSIANIEVDNGEMEKDLLKRASTRSPGSSTFDTYESIDHTNLSGSVESDASDKSCDPKSTFPFKCNFCGKLYQKESYYQEHMRKSTCEICNIKESCHRNLALHKMHKHENAKTFVCEICGKAYKFKHALKEHLLTHTEDRPHVCVTCSKGFKHPTHLKYHSNFHLEPKFQCDTCGKKTFTKGTLRVHKMKHGAPNLRCAYCGKFSYCSSALKKHMLMHIGVKPFVCKYCQKSFTSRVLCVNHKLRVHPKEYEQDDDKNSSPRIPTPGIGKLRKMMSDLAASKKNNLN